MLIPSSPSSPSLPPLRCSPLANEDERINTQVSLPPEGGLGGTHRLMSSVFRKKLLLSPDEMMRQFLLPLLFRNPSFHITRGVYCAS